jgi:fibronectin-binding autotransporter adhesin
MNRLVKNPLCILMYAFLWACAPVALAKNCVSKTSGNWNVGGTWKTCGGTFPQAGDTATVQGAVTISVTAPATVASLVVNGDPSGDTTLAVGTQTLTIAGGLTLNGDPSGNFALLTISSGTVTVGGTLSVTGAAGGTSVQFTGAGNLFIAGDFQNGLGSFVRGTGTVTYNGNAAQSVGAYTYYNLTVNNTGGTATLSGNAPVASNLTVSSGTLDLSTFTANRTAAGGTISVGAGATLSIGGTGTFPSNYTTHTLNATSTVNYAGTNQTVTAENYGTLILSGSGTKTMPAAAFTTATDFLMQGTAVATSLNTISVGRDFTMSGTATFTAGNALTVSRDFTLGAGTTFNAASYTHNVARNFTNNGGTFSASTGTINLNGAAAQVIGGTSSTTFNNLTIANTAGGVSLGANETVNGTLTLTSGIVNTTSAYTLTSGGNCTTNVVRTSGWVAGNLQLHFPAGTPTCTFHIGDAATNYTPVTIAFTSATPAGNLTATVTNTDHPNTTGGADGIDSTKDVTRYWTLKGSTVAGTYTGTFNYVSGDIKVGATQANFVAASGQNCTGSGAARSCSPWASPASTNPTGTSTRATGNSIANGSLDIDFAVGEGTNTNFARERQFIYTRELY